MCPTFFNFVVLCQELTLTTMSVAEAFGDVASSIAQMDPDKISALKSSGFYVHTR